jgi:hypothetical protein
VKEFPRLVVLQHNMLGPFREFRIHPSFAIVLGSGPAVNSFDAQSLRRVNYFCGRQM